MFAVRSSFIGSDALCVVGLQDICGVFHVLAFMLFLLACFRLALLW